MPSSSSSCECRKPARRDQFALPSDAQCGQIGESPSVGQRGRDLGALRSGIRTVLNAGSRLGAHVTIAFQIALISNRPMLNILVFVCLSVLTEGQQLLAIGI